jgi:hypothetical protein
MDKRARRASAPLQSIAYGVAGTSAVPPPRPPPLPSAPSTFDFLERVNFYQTQHALLVQQYQAQQAQQAQVPNPISHLLTREDREALERDASAILEVHERLVAELEEALEGVGFMSGMDAGGILGLGLGVVDGGVCECEVERWREACWRVEEASRVVCDVYVREVS